MSKSGKSVIVFIILAVILGLHGCSAMPQTIKNMFSSPTPTSTITPIPSKTPTPTPDPTAKPTMSKAPLDISTCLDKKDCPSAIAVTDILSDGIRLDETNEIRLPYDQTLKLDYGWIAKNQDYLDKNLQHIKWVFTIDDQDFFTNELLVNSEENDKDVSGGKNPGTWLAVTLSGWETGKPHYIRYGYYVDEAIDDGWAVTAADLSSIYTLHVVPVEESTVTPSGKVIKTLQPKPVVTKVPGQPTVQPTATEGAPLVLNITLRVENKCAEAHVVIFNGPMRLKYNVAPGQTEEFQAATGTYTWKIDNSFNGGPQTLDASMGYWLYTLCQ